MKATWLNFSENVLKLCVSLNWRWPSSRTFVRAGTGLLVIWIIKPIKLESNCRVPLEELKKRQPLFSIAAPLSSCRRCGYVLQSLSSFLHQLLIFWTTGVSEDETSDTDAARGSGVELVAVRDLWSRVLVSGKTRSLTLSSSWEGPWMQTSGLQTLRMQTSPGTSQRCFCRRL